MNLRLIISAFLIAIISMAASCEGDTNELDDKRDNITHSWHATLNGDVPENYEVKVTKDDTDETKLYLANFVNNGEENVAEATITGMQLTVAEQEVGNTTVSATGTISDDYQNISWTMTMDGDDFTCDFVPGGITKDLEL